MTWAVKMNGNTTSGIDDQPAVQRRAATRHAADRSTHLQSGDDAELHTGADGRESNHCQYGCSAERVPTASVPVEPGETILITLRITGTTTFNPAAAGVRGDGAGEEHGTRDRSGGCSAGLQHLGPDAVLHERRAEGRDAADVRLEPLTLR